MGNIDGFGDQNLFKWIWDYSEDVRAFGGLSYKENNGNLDGYRRIWRDFGIKRDIGDLGWI